jgi:hypothetical protein
MHGTNHVTEITKNKAAEQIQTIWREILSANDYKRKNKKVSIHGTIMTTRKHKIRLDNRQILYGEQKIGLEKIMTIKKE